MPIKKRQHYVPRCYLKPFSLDGNGKTINVYNITQSKLISNAPIKGQCAKDYFYGRDLNIENKLQNIEREYANTACTLQGNVENLSNDDMEFLRFFALLQYARTDMAAKRMRLLRENMRDVIFEGRHIAPPVLDLSDYAMMRDSLDIVANEIDNVDDIKICIIKNNTKNDFITSDDPVIFTNRFYLQKLHRNTFGLKNSGLLFFMPITPQFLLMCYDGGIYTIPDRQGKLLIVTKCSDISCLNELQYMKSVNNIYFSEWHNRELIKTEFNKKFNYRPESWVEIEAFVRVNSENSYETYRIASAEERQGGEHTLINPRSCHNAPSQWFSMLKYRHSQRTYFNKTMIGYVRKKAWLHE